MDRDELAAQVMTEYARLVSAENKQCLLQTEDDIAPGMYYENLLGILLADIHAGTFDSFHSGREVIEAVVNGRSTLTLWDINDPRR